MNNSNNGPGNPGGGKQQNSALNQGLSSSSGKNTLQKLLYDLLYKS
jgi:hypothetical protein